MPVVAMVDGKTQPYRFTPSIAAAGREGNLFILILIPQPSSQVEYNDISAQILTSRSH
ncbi:MAG: hypothetical protein OJF52_003145 [Nitrospira sp.]|nr:MAG: hypothetical protein OJF52_003145 [Nitrospira sp.]